MTHVREHRSILAAAEKRLLIRIAERLPRAINSDHLTTLALGAMALAGAAFAAARWDRRAFWFVVVALALNWFGDSLDGTLARVRRARAAALRLLRRSRTRHCGHDAALCRSGVLAVHDAGRRARAPRRGTCSSPAEVFLATAVRGVFRMSVGGIGPTELRIVLAAGTLALFHDPHISMGALTVRLFDFAGVIASRLIAAFVAAAVRNTTAACGR